MLKMRFKGTKRLAEFMLGVKLVPANVLHTDGGFDFDVAFVSTLSH